MESSVNSDSRGILADSRRHAYAAVIAGRNVQTFVIFGTRIG